MRTTLDSAVVNWTLFEHVASAKLALWRFPLLGARTGRDLHPATEHFAAFNMVSIDVGTCMYDDASLDSYTIKDGELVNAPAQIGPRCLVGTWSVLRDGAVIFGAPSRI
jgi:hypothetical protein